MSEIASTLLSILRDEPAYLDPGSGSFILQLLLAALLGAGVALRIYWKKVLGLFGVKPKPEDAREEDSEEDLD